MSKLSGLFSIGIADVVGSVATAIFWFYIATLLNPDQYGQLSYFIGIAGTASAFSLIGTQNTITVYAAKNFRVLSSLYTLSTISVSISAIVVSLMFYRVDVSLLLLGYVLSGLALGHILGNKYYSDYSKYVLAQKILTLVLGIGFYYFWNPESIIYALVASYIPFVLVLYKMFKQIKFGFADLKLHLGFIVNNYVITLSGRLAGQIDKLIIAPLFGFTLLGNYSLATQVATVSLIFSQMVFKYTLSHDSTGNQNKRLKKITIFIAVLISILGIIISPILVPILFPKYVDAVQIIQIMILGVIPATINLQYTSRLLGLEKSRFILIGTMLGLITMVASIVTLGPHFGVVGLACAYVLADTVPSVYYYLANRTEKGAQIG